MYRRVFLNGPVGGLQALAGMSASLAGMTPGPFLTDAREQGGFPCDDCQKPDWLHYARPVYLNGYSPPVDPHLKGFDARKAELS
jgi:hypothetical protein